MTKQTFTTSDGTTITYDPGTKAVDIQSPKAVHPLLWEPKDGDSVFWLDNLLIPQESRYASCAQLRWLAGEIFPTREAAEKARGKKLARMRVLREIARLNDGWEADWGNTDQRKYYVYREHKEGRFYLSFWQWSQNQFGDMYLKSDAAAQSLIQTHEADLRILFDLPPRP